MEPASEARSAALRLIKFRPRSEAEIKGRLAEKGFGDETVRAVMEEMRRTGLVGDARFARYAAAQAAAKPVGRRLILNRLREKGIAPELAEEAARAATEGKDELERAREAAGRRAPTLEGLPREAARRRLFGFLSRRGFSSEVIWKVVKEATQRHPHGLNVILTKVRIRSSIKDFEDDFVDSRPRSGRGQAFRGNDCV